MTIEITEMIILAISMCFTLVILTNAQTTSVDCTYRAVNEVSDNGVPQAAYLDPLIIECTMTLETGDSVFQIQVFESDGAVDGVRVFNGGGGDPATGSLLNDLLNRGSFVYDASSLTLSITIDSYNDTGVDTEHYNCILDTNGFRTGNYILHIDSRYNLPAAVELSLDGIADGINSVEFNEGDAEITIRSSGYDDGGSNTMVYPTFTVWVDDVERSLTEVSDTEMTLSLNDLSARSATYNVTIRTALWSVEEIRTLDVTIEKEEENKKDKCHRSQPIRKCWWKMFLMILGIIVGAAIIAAIITFILYKMKIGCFAKKGSH